MTLTDVQPGQPCGRRTAFHYGECLSLHLGGWLSVAVFVKVQVLREVKPNGQKKCQEVAWKIFALQLQTTKGVKDFPGDTLYPLTFFPLG
jgi:hypothetical protein